jgi:crotonobetainyl-CoA:carnitine CoA-transferase CaiB-like acyl-CoA transferase
MKLHRGVQNEVTYLQSFFDVFTHKYIPPQSIAFAMLDDITLLDFTQSIAGPTCTEYLGALGADVIKVEPPTGDPFRRSLDGAIFSSINTFKRSVSMDLKTDEGPAITASLAEDADVVVESFRPGKLADFGLDYESIREVNDDVVYCSITGFGQDGPYRDRPAYDPILQAMSGIMHNTGYADRPPVRIGTSPIDFGTGMVASFLIVSAIRNRDNTGEGAHIDATLYDTAIRWMSGYIARYLGTGDIPQRAGSSVHGYAPYGVFNADGKPFYLSVPNDKLYERLCRLFDREDLIEDDQFSDMQSRWENRDAIEDEFAQEFEDWDRTELVAYLTENDVPAGPVQDVAEVAESDPHVQETGMLTETYDFKLDKPIKTANVPFRMSTYNGHPEYSGKPPKLGENTVDVLREHGFSRERIDSLLDREIVHAGQEQSK